MDEHDIPITRFRLALLDWGGPQCVLAEAAGLPSSRISEYALGHRPIPTKHLITLSRLLHRNPADLVGWATAEEAPCLG